MARRYFVTPLPAPGSTVLPAEVAHHATSVNRLREGEPIVLFDGAGREAMGSVASIRRGEVRVDVASHRDCTREVATELTVAFAAPRANRAERLFEQGCELGIRHFVPLLTERTRPGSDRDNRVERWNRITQAAAGQCDRAFVPTVARPVTLAEWLTTELPSERYVADVTGDPLGRAAERAAVIAIGPEGGFTDQERELLASHDFAGKGLGPLTLRTETAVLAAAVRLLS